MVVLKSARRHLHYEDVGAGRLILLVHGFTNYGLSWAPQLAALVHSGYRVIIPDLYGHGMAGNKPALVLIPKRSNSCKKSELPTSPANTPREMSSGESSPP
jgi:pimeloyl-ACP methyl ester carboxylesterase